MRSRLAHAAYGVLATLLGVAAAHLVAALTDPASSPVLAVGSTVVDLTPTPVKEWAVARFGTSDKPILIGSVFAGVLVLSAVAGMLARRRFLLGAGMLVGLVAVAGAAALGRPTAGLSDVLPAVVAGVVAVAALTWLVRLAGSRDGRDRPRATAASPTRRGVLISAGAMAAAAVAMGAAGRRITRARGVIKDLTLPAAAEPAPAFPEGLEGRYPGIAPLRTPNADFYRIDTRLTLPVIDRDTWTLTIDGDVDQEITLGFDDLLEMPLIERDITLTCVSNEVGGPYVGGTRWTGVRLTDLLDRAGIGSTAADQILSTDVDGMTISTPLDLATDGRDAMIAIAMDGQPLPRDHGYPARMVVPGLYGYVSACKWITRMTLTTYDEKTAYWTDRGWAIEAPIKLMSRIDTPRPLSNIKAGRTFVGGVAWHQHRGLTGVQVRIDGGEWQDARLGPDAGNDYWRQWYLVWDAGSSGPGQHTLAARALDENGEPQSAARATPFPDGASGVQSIVVSVA
ncbi:MAG TPA: molybdopterin-dependent oxidoreductase [Nocardioides sp.]|nr:molybdopterin-dependent oxidoreductase [Nocardioides sp.]